MEQFPNIRGKIDYFLDMISEFIFLIICNIIFTLFNLRLWADLSKHDLLLIKTFCQHGLYQNDIKLRGKNFNIFSELDYDTKIGFCNLIDLVCKNGWVYEN